MGARRTISHAEPGQLYAVEWIEWYVNCAKCQSQILVAPLGSLNAKEAEAQMVQKETEEDSTGWQRRKGLWYCRCVG